MRRLLLVLILLLPCLLPLEATAAGLTGSFNPDAADKRLTEIYRTLVKPAKPGAASAEAIDRAIATTVADRQQAQQCIASASDVVGKIKEALTAIGQPVAGEPSDIAAERHRLSNANARFVGQLALCRLLIVHANELFADLANLQQNRLKAELVSRGQDVVSLIVANLHAPLQWWVSGREFVAANSGLNLFTRALTLAFLILVGIAVPVGIWIRRRLKDLVEALPEQNLIQRLLRALAASLGQFAPVLAPVGVAALIVATMTDTDNSQVLILLLIYGLLAYELALIAIRTVLWPPPPAHQITPFPDPLAQATARRLIMLSLLVPIGYLLLATNLDQAMPEAVFLLARAVFVTIVIVNLVWLVWLLRTVPQFHVGLRLLVIVGLAIALAAELTGFRSLADLLYQGMSGTLLAGALFWGLSTLIREILDGFDQGGHRWQRWLRRNLGLDHGEGFPGLMWLRAVFLIVLWAALALALLKVWGLPESRFTTIFTYIFEGFHIGQLSIVPSRLVVGLFTFVIFLSASRWLANRLERRLLDQVRIDPGTRHAMVTISIYTGFIIAVLIGLSVAGVDFASIAIVAGALSVGIGFGLQNIVNNFVSGIILLFERPIRKGDWVVVGGTEGIVKLISVRSTRLQTFDRADVIVPNSELISQQVTNWTLHDLVGRLTISIGVAYGSDTEMVRNLLLEIARANPEVITDDSAPGPNVVFTTFGASTLNFDLRCMVRNVGLRGQVTSDLNFAIDKAFRERGVEMAFPQQDIHVRTWPGLPAGEAPPPAAAPTATSAPPPEGKTDKAAS